MADERPTTPGMGFLARLRGHQTTPPPPTADQAITAAHVPLPTRLGYGPNLVPASPIGLNGTSGNEFPYGPQHAQQRLIDYQRGYRTDGHPVSGGGIVSFVADTYTRMSGRCPRPFEKWDPVAREWVEPEASDQELPVLHAWQNSFHSHTQNFMGLTNRRLRLWVFVGEYYVVRYDHPHTGNLVYNVAGPDEVAEERNGAIRWTAGGQQHVIESGNWWRIIRDDRSDNEPFSPWFASVDDLESLDGMLASIDRSVASRLFNRKVVVVKPGGPSIPTYGTQNHPGGYMPAPGEQKVRGDSAIGAIRNAGNQSIKGHNRNPAHASGVILEGDYEIDVIDPLVSIDEKVMEAIAIRTDAIARASSLPSSFIRSGFADDNHWSALFTERGVLESAFAPDAQGCDDAFMHQMARHDWHRIGIVNPAEWRMRVDYSDLEHEVDRTDDLMRAYQMGLVSRQTVIAELKLPEDVILKLPEGVEEYDHWSGNVGPFSDVSLHDPGAMTQRRQAGGTPTQRGPISAAHRGW